jgi:hypothetical protein
MEPPPAPIFRGSSAGVILPSRHGMPAGPRAHHFFIPSSASKGTIVSHPTPRLRVAVLAAVLSAGALALSGCTALSDLFPKEAARDTETQEISEAGETDVFSLAVGDCFNDQDAEEINSVEAIPCGDPHDYEAYFAFDLPDADTYPGADSVSQAAQDGCIAEFTTFVGAPYENAAPLDFNFLSPTEGSWGEGDREILCIVMDTEKTTGSLAGAAA